MRLDDYSFSIPEGRETEEGYVYLHHGTKYTIRLDNAGDRRCDAKITIDGKSVGSFRVDAYDSFLIERPAEEDGCFTFYKSGSPEAESAQLGDDDSLGLISVEFRPERISSGIDSETKLYQSALRTPSEAGGTGLSGESKQEFNSTKALTSDPAEHVTIHLRLVCEPNDARPLHKRETNIPPALNRAEGNPLHGESAVSASGAYANKQARTESLPGLDARKRTEGTPMRAVLPTPIKPAAPEKFQNRTRGQQAKKSTKLRSIRCDCKKCGISGEAEVANHRTSVICPQCAGFAYRQIGMNRLNFSVGIAVTVAVFVIITFLGGEVPPGFILAIPLIALSSYRCANIGCSFLWALIPVIPWLSIFLTFPSQIPNPSKLKRGQECSNFTVSSGVPATRSFSASTWMAFILWYINLHRIKLAVASLLIVSVIVYWVVSDGDEDRNSTVDDSRRSAVPSQSSESETTAQATKESARKLYEPLAGTADNKDSGTEVESGEPTVNDLELLNEVAKEIGNEINNLNEMYESELHVDVLADKIVDFEWLSTDGNLAIASGIAHSARLVIAKFKERHREILLSIPDKIRARQFSPDAKMDFSTMWEQKFRERMGTFEEIWNEDLQYVEALDDIVDHLKESRNRWTFENEQILFDRDADLDKIHKLYDAAADAEEQRGREQSKVQQEIDQSLKRLDELTR